MMIWVVLVFLDLFHASYFPDPAARQLLPGLDACFIRWCRAICLKSFGRPDPFLFVVGLKPFYAGLVTVLSNRFRL